MEKLVYLLAGDASVAGPALRTGILDEAAPALRAAGATQIGVSLDDEDVAAGAGVRIGKAEPPIRAMISFWMENADDRAPCEAALSAHAESISGYLTVESRPTPFEAPRGERAPGMNLVTCIKKRPDITAEHFFDCWNNEHKIVARETQSTFAYTRNAVVRALTDGAHPWDGVVEESFPIGALTDPKVWYDCDTDEEYKKRVTRMVESVTAFLDLSDMESIPMSQYWLG
jgi:hypothetical protein